MSNALHWAQATVSWAPEFSQDTLVLRIPASIRDHARAILLQTLPPAIESLADRSVGGELLIDVQASEVIDYEDGSTGVEPGQVVITAEHLTETFEAEELRRRLDALAAEAVREGDARALRNQERADRFLEDLKADE